MTDTKRPPIARFNQSRPQTPNGARNEGLEDKVRMNKILVVMMVLIPAWSAATLQLPGGQWIGSSISFACGAERVCVEWDEPEGEMHGAVCCVAESDLDSRTFLPACQVIVRAPRTE